MELRAIAEEELEAFYTGFMRTMGFGPPTDAYLEREKATFQYDRSVAAIDEGAIVGTAYSHLFELTLPGGAKVPAAGVTAVSVASTHRRRGIVTDLKRRQLMEARDRGEPVAILLASEGRIYRRFGYGVTTQIADIRIEVRDARVEHRPVPGRIRIVEGEAMDAVAPAVHAAMAARQPGAISRPPHFWSSATADRDKRTSHVVRENVAGEPDGYARYDVRADWKDGLPAHKLTLHDLVATNDDAWFALWSYVLGVDLVREVSAMGRPIDEPLRWVLDEPRAVRSATLRDLYWLRPLDVEALLGGRTYSADVDLTLEVHDPMLDLGGVFTLTGGRDGAVCTRGSASPDLRLSMAELGSIALGGITATELARAGRIEECTAGTVARADLAFVQTPRPWGDVYF